MVFFLPDKVNPGLPDFDAEAERLLEEMKSNDKEGRLLRIKNQDWKSVDKEPLRQSRFSCFADNMI